MLPVIPRQKKVFKSKYFPGGKLTLMPWTNGMEMPLLMIKDSDSIEDRMTAIKDVINDSIVENINIDTLPIFVIEYIFLLLRSISIGEVIPLSFICTNEIEEEKKCGNVLDIVINIEDIQIKDNEIKTVFMLSDTIGVKFKFPTILTTKNATQSSDKEAIISCIDQIFDGDQVWDSTSYQKSDIDAFYDSIPLKNKMEIYREFFSKIPTIYYEQKKVCSKCGHTHNIIFDNINDVFQ